MTVKENIRKMIAKQYNEADANACEIWKGWGEMGQAPYGWWVQPFGRTAYFVGSLLAEAQEFFGAQPQ